MKEHLQEKKRFSAIVFFAVFIEILSIGLALGLIDVNALYYPTLNTGDSLNFSSDSKDRPNSSSPTCMRIEYAGGENGYGAIIWRYPENNIGEMDGRDLTGVKRLTFYARGENPRGSTEFVVGAFKDDTSRSNVSINLTENWEQYSIPLSGKDLRNIRGGFACKMTSQCVIYLDDIYYER